MSKTINTLSQTPAIIRKDRKRRALRLIQNLLEIFIMAGLAFLVLVVCAAFYVLLNYLVS